ncbi:MAG: hypothetical protein JO061_10380 [Acidobacteriaceae bacterium]|nr:hypothetical protein [Acidobacteriaceae bacterium]
MRTPTIALFTACLGLSLAAAVHAEDFKVIANESVETSAVSLDDLKSVFLETKAQLGSGHVVPVLEKAGPAHAAFLKDCLAKSDTALSTYYRSLVFTGKGTLPKALASDSDVVDFVSKTKGAIGYVSPSAASSSVKTLEVK